MTPLDPVLVTVGIVWNDLDEKEKTSLHLAVNWPGKSLAGLKGSDKFEHLGTEANGAPHASTIEAVNKLAARWHAEADRLTGETP